MPPKHIVLPYGRGRRPRRQWEIDLRKLRGHNAGIRLRREKGTVVGKGEEGCGLGQEGRKGGERDIRGKQEKGIKAREQEKGTGKERPLPSGLWDRPVIHKGPTDIVDDVKLNSTPTFSVLGDSTPFKKALLEKRNKKEAVWRVSTVTGFTCVCTLQCHAHSLSLLSLSLRFPYLLLSTRAQHFHSDERATPSSSDVDRTFDGKDVQSKWLPYSTSFPIFPHRRRRLRNVSRDVKSRNGAISFDGPFRFQDFTQSSVAGVNGTDCRKRICRKITFTLPYTF